jgi:hypothetical protein
MITEQAKNLVLSESVWESFVVAVEELFKNDALWFNRVCGIKNRISSQAQPLSSKR